MKKIIAAVAIPLSLMSFSAFSQSRSDIETLLQSGVADVNTYLNHYVQPAAEGFAYSMGAGWANTAKTHSTLGFDFKIGVSAAAVPSRMESFLFDPSQYNNLRVSGETGPTELPTLFGSESPGRTLDIYEDGFVAAQVDALPGAGMPVNYVPAPVLQAGLGLPFGTDIKLRFLPNTRIEGVEVGILGGGIQHDIKQHIPGLRELPFHLSGLVAFNSLKAGYALEEITDGRGELQVNTWTYQLLLSKKLSVFTFYGSAGYISGTSDFDLLGTYNVSNFTNPIVDPISLRYAVAGAMGNVGVRVDLGPIFLNADYTFQEFNILTAGLGFSIR
ncbi:hypothetical protein KIH41_16020 [Litoribacter ruber]|uniref:Uncharacterized protein n=1 Tax=Litoribacter ruber TaxID=702568 RepID=A0AAP2G5H7_9BACT|nr:MULTISPECIES: DUF6588 family protein [Litoribacter]MBS9525545.1 hypothetical protein [Litoribacter alkaliphilus]MBT0812794.1 hypothetical protein [Litoribacter ruber]